METIPDASVNILLVDDRPENLLALEALLENPRLNLVKAGSGAEALGFLLDRDFALVLLDVQMPDMNGFETAELMRGSERSKQIPIIFITALNKDQKYIFKGYEAGAVDYLFKPIEAEILRSKVNVFSELYRQKKLILEQFNELGRQKKLVEDQLAEIKTLRGFFPICAYCKKVLTDQGHWEAIEVYVSNHSEAKFSHGICPECVIKVERELDSGNTAY